MAATLLVATEAHFVRGTDGRVYSSSGVDGYAFWSRYRSAFDRILVAARTSDAAVEGERVILEGPGVEVVPLPDYVGPWQCLRVTARLRSTMALVEWPGTRSIRTTSPPSASTMSRPTTCSGL